MQEGARPGPARERDLQLGDDDLRDVGAVIPEDVRRSLDEGTLARLFPAHGVAVTVELLLANGFRILHVDSTVMMERPKIAPFRDSIRTTLAGALALPLGLMFALWHLSETWAWVGTFEMTVTAGLAAKADEFAAAGKDFYLPPQG